MPHAPQPPAHLLIARRAARAAFGLALTGGMLVLASLSPAIKASRWTHEPLPHAGQGLLVVWLGAFGVAAVVWLWARLALRLGSLPVLERAGGGPSAPVACAVGIHPGVQRAERLEAWGLALPLVGLSFAMPLTIHGLVVLLFGGNGREFTDWVVLSSAIVGHAHLALAVLSSIYAVSLCRRGNENPALTGVGVLGITTAVAALPGVIFLGLPPLLTLITGLAFVPAMFAWARRTLADERLILRGRSPITR